MPVGLTTGGRDALVPPDSVVRLAAILKRLQPNVLLIHRPEGGHETNYADGKAVLDFVIAKAGL
jgi:LmbE family N-acetylglucosaminyl deacetylase